MQRLLTAALTYCFLVSVSFTRLSVIIISLNNDTLYLPAVVASFGAQLPHEGVSGILTASKSDACDNSTIARLENKSKKAILLVPRGNCTFEQKIYNSQRAGYDSVIIYETLEEPSNATNFHEFPYSFENFRGLINMQPISLGKDIVVPSVYISAESGVLLTKEISEQASLFMNCEITIFALNYFVDSETTYSEGHGLLADLLIIILISISFTSACGIITILSLLLTRHRVIYERLSEKKKNILTMDELEKLSVSKYYKQSSSGESLCAICLDEFNEGDPIRSLGCSHLFHTQCVDGWLLNSHRSCPICRQDPSKVKTFYTESIGTDEL